MDGKLVTVSALVILALVCVVNADVTMDDICKKHHDAGRCKLPSIKQACKICGGGGDGDDKQQKDIHEPTENHEDITKPTRPTTRRPTAARQQQQQLHHCDKRSPCVPMDTGNKNFRDRCQATDLKDTCYDHCRYDEETAVMKKAFMGGKCPLSQLRTYLTAASKGKDNTACCSDTGVLSQKKTAICGCFCNPTGDVWPQKGEAGKYAPCVGVLEGIMQCHYFAEGAD